MKLKLQLTPQMSAYLDQLVSTGLYGASREEAALRLIERGLIDMIAGGVLVAKEG